MVGHMGRFDQIRLAGEVGGDLREQIGCETVKGGLQGVNATT